MLHITRRKLSSNAAAQADDFLSRHGGKVAFAALSLAGYLFYSFYQSGQNRNLIEEALSDEYPLEPYEVNELRHANQLNGDVYDGIVRAAVAQFPGGSCSYADFLRLVSARHSILSGHLLDRLVLKQSKREEPLPLPFLFTSLLTTVSASAERRVESLMQIGQRLEGRVDKGSSLRVETAEQLVQELVATCQVPVERMVIETGVKYPFKTYRPKTAADLVLKARQNFKPPHVGETLTEEEFLGVLLGAEICAWGECYKER